MNRPPLGFPPWSCTGVTQRGRSPGHQGKLPGSSPSTALLQEKALTSLPGAWGWRIHPNGDIIQLLAQFGGQKPRQQLRSYVGQAEACKGGGHPPPPSSVFMPVLAFLLGGSLWGWSPNLTQWYPSRVAKDIGCLCILAAGLSPLKEV